MAKCLFILLLIGVILLQCNCYSINKTTLLDVSENTENSEIVIRNGECGGTVELDEGTLIYPGDGFIQPGELCIWTIHLRTMDGFRMNFTHLNLPGGISSCVRSAVGIYGLSNLIPQDNLEQHRICNENNNVGHYFLTANIATVVLYTSSSFPPNGSAHGFSLHWQGSRFQPSPTEHSATYSVAPSGIVWYPFEGEYPPNAGMTWLVKGVRSTDPAPTLIDIDVIFVDLESCNLADKCLCDAVIIYDISRTGELHEVDRFCGDKENGQFANVHSNFIVAFYSDTPNVPQRGFGFQVVWRQGSVLPTTTDSWEETTTPWWEWTTATTESGTTVPEETTTEFYWPTTSTEYYWPTTTSVEYPTTTEYYWPTSTTENPTTGNWEATTPQEVTSCGGVIEGVSGSISYKYGYQYNNNERCIWTVRLSPPYTELELTLRESGFELRHDFISAFSFVQKSGLVDSFNLGQTSNNYQQVVLNGSVVIVKFSSDRTTTGTGFLLDFRARGSPSRNISYYRDYQSTAYSGSSLEYPGRGSNYQNQELSTFVLTRGTQEEEGNGILWALSLLSYNIENQAAQCRSGGQTCGCDGLLVYALEADLLTLISPPICGLREGSTTYMYTAHTFILVFYSNADIAYEGFNISWNYEYESTATTPYGSSWWQ